MTLRDWLFVVGCASSFAGCFVLHRLLAGLGVPAYAAITLGSVASLAAHYWFWVEWYGVNSRHGSLMLWLGIHPIYPFAAIGMERDARRKRAAGQPPGDA
jgi:hypothetical protein